VSTACTIVFFLPACSKC